MNWATYKTMANNPTVIIGDINTPIKKTGNVYTQANRPWTTLMIDAGLRSHRASNSCIATVFSCVCAKKFRFSSISGKIAFTQTGQLYLGEQTS